MNKRYLIVGWFLSLLTPFILIMTSIRLMITPAFAIIEYNMPYFPADPYGFSQQDRIQWSRYAINYLVNNRDISYLAGLTFPDGSSLYAARELTHMEDVKIVVLAMIRFWLVFLAILVGCGIWSWYGKWFKHYLQSLARGGVITIILILTVLVFVAISFSALFANFHKLFFADGTWLFQYSDTLIRLFPMRFWQDAFTGVGILTILFSIGLIACGKWLSPKFTSQS